jgi:hypothetical protein
MTATGTAIALDMTTRPPPTRPWLAAGPSGPQAAR